MSTNSLSSEDRAARDELIFSLRKQGWSHREIIEKMWGAYQIHCTVSVVQNAIRNRKAILRKELKLDGK